MSRRRTVSQGEVADAFGDLWWIAETRPTKHGWPVLLGFPLEPVRQGMTTILTQSLVDHLEAHRRDNFAQMDLPLGDGTIKRLRKMLGHHRYADARAWWDERIDDLSDLTLDKFAAKHGCTAGATEWARLHLLGKTKRDAGWWREGAAKTILLTKAPRAWKANALGISIGSVGRLAWRLRQDEEIKNA